MTTTTRLQAAIDERERALSALVDSAYGRLAEACHALARAFSRGGKLIIFGEGAAATDAAHVAVEFMHPVIVGKRALPALALTNDPTQASTLAALSGPEDVAVALTHGAPGDELTAALRESSRRGLLTIAFTGSAAQADADFAFAVESDDPLVVQEVQETAYHVLWELVHVFFEHPGLVEADAPATEPHGAEACITCGDVAVRARVVEVRDASAIIERDGAREEVAVELVSDVAVGDELLCHAGVALERLEGAPAESGDADDPSGFLYPFLAREESDLASVLADVGASTVRKAADTRELRARIDLDAIEVCAGSVRQRLAAGGRLIAFGNGGSSTDAQDAAADFLAAGWPALALTNDVATVTAVANDVGFENVFARQLIALAGEADVVLGISTSGSSPNIAAGLAEAHRRGALTCAITGYDGGRLAELDWLDHLFIVGGDYIPRLQEAHATVYHLLLEATGSAR